MRSGFGAGSLPSLIVFILNMIPNSWASDGPARIPQQRREAKGLGRGALRLEPAPGMSSALGIKGQFALTAFCWWLL